MKNKVISLCFFGGLRECHILKRKDLPDEARYICTTENYDIYDGQDYTDKFYAVKDI